MWVCVSRMCVCAWGGGVGVGGTLPKQQKFGVSYIIPAVSSWRRCCDMVMEEMWLFAWLGHPKSVGTNRVSGKFLVVRVPPTDGLLREQTTVLYCTLCTTDHPVLRARQRWCVMCTLEIYTVWNRLFFLTSFKKRKRKERYIPDGDVSVKTSLCFPKQDQEENKTP